MPFNTPAVDGALDTVVEQFGLYDVIVGSYIRIPPRFMNTEMEDEAVVQGVLYINAPKKHVQDCFALVERRLVALSKAEMESH